jgi:hypothetical protein
MSPRSLVTLLGALALLAPPMGATRLDFLRTPMLEWPRQHHAVRQFDCPVPARTAQYASGGVSLPRAPVLHAYHMGEDLRAGHAWPEFPYAIRFPADFWEALPPSLLTRLQAADLGPERLDIFCVIQNQPWRDGVLVLLRPHYWTDPEAPEIGTYQRSRKVRVGLFAGPERKPGIAFSGRPADAWFEAGISVHPHTQEGAGVILSSGPNLAVDGLDYHRSDAFWSLVQCGDRGAATLHLVLDDADLEALAGLAPASGEAWTVETLVGRLGESEALRETAWVAALRALTGPLVTVPRVEPRAGTGQADLVLVGTGFTETKVVLVGGEPAAAFQVETDHRIRARVPEALAGGPVRVVTGLGDTAAPGARTGLGLESKARTPAKGAGEPRDDNRWRGGPWRRFRVPADGIVSEYQTIPCGPGDVVTGTCQVAAETKRTAQGQLMIGLRFESDDHPDLGSGKPLDEEVPMAAGTARQGPLGVCGTAPDGATRARLFIRGTGLGQGVRVDFQDIQFGIHTDSPFSLPPAALELLEGAGSSTEILMNEIFLFLNSKSGDCQESKYSEIKR